MQSSATLIKSASYIRALETRPRGQGTSKDIANMSAAITKTLITQEAQISSILADTSRTPAQKSVFFRQLLPVVRDNLTLDTTEGMHNTSKDKLKATLPKRKELSTHQAILLAQALKEADPAKMHKMVGSDEGYLTILKDMPYSYFGIDEKMYDGLIQYAADVSSTPEQNEQAMVLENDKTQISILKAAKAALVDEMEHYITEAIPDLKKADSTSHLYQL